MIVKFLMSRSFLRYTVYLIRLLHISESFCCMNEVHYDIDHLVGNQLSNIGFDLTGHIHLNLHYLSKFVPVFDVLSHKKPNSRSNLTKRCNQFRKS